MVTQAGIRRKRVPIRKQRRRSFTETDRLKVTLVPGAGRGVVAKVPFQRGDTIERCPVIFLSKEDWEATQSTDLCRYFFDDAREEGVGLALGFGSLFNHDDVNPNAEFGYDEETLELDGGPLLLVTAIRPIEPGDEIRFSYGYDLAAEGFIE